VGWVVPCRVPAVASCTAWSTGFPFGCSVAAAGPPVRESVALPSGNGGTRPIVSFDKAFGGLSVLGAQAGDVNAEQGRRRPGRTAAADSLAGCSCAILASSSGEGPMVRRLAAGGRWIRTSGPASEVCAGEDVTSWANQTQLPIDAARTQTRARRHTGIAPARPRAT